MGSRTYEFLADSFLFDGTLIAEKFASVSNQQLEKEMRRYHEFATTEAPTIEAEISTDPSNLVIVSDEAINPRHLVQSSLYVNQYVFDDPRFRPQA